MPTDLCEKCSHPRHDGAEPIFDEDDDSPHECGNCQACFDRLKEAVEADRANRPAQYRPLS